jgi:hypothetical protein
MRGSVCRHPLKLTCNSVLFLAATAIVPWILGRFSLRTQLIATTLVAVVLGLIAAVLKRSAG